jgi:phage terminase small subunit
MSIRDSAPNSDDPTGQSGGKGTRYSPALWEAIRKEWAADPSMSYATAVKIIGERLGVPVPSKGACATYATRNGWAKDGAEGVQPSDAAPEPVAAAPSDSHAPKRLPARPVPKQPAPAEDASEIVDDEAHGLNPRQRRFADFYLISLNATDAYKKAGYAGNDAVAASEGSKLLRHPKVAAYIATRQAVLQEKLEITQEMVLKRWWDIANANVNELVEYRRNCCRFCWGVGFSYQWTKEEFDRATRKHLLDCTKAEARGKPAPEPPDGAGGDGFDRNREPNPQCPECAGEGYGYAHYHDSRRLSPQALMLYDGVKITKEGIEVLKLDRAKALDNVARHIGMFKEKVEIDVSVTSTAELEAVYDQEVERARARALEFKGRGDRLKVVGGGE